MLALVTIVVRCAEGFAPPCAPSRRAPLRTPFLTLMQAEHPLATRHKLSKSCLQ